MFRLSIVCGCLLLLWLCHASTWAQTILISEIDIDSPDAVEFVNVSGTSINVGGWTVYLYDSTSYPGIHTSFSLPANTIIAPDRGFVVYESGSTRFSTAECQYFKLSAELNWSNSLTSKTAVLLRDSGGAAVDFFIASGLLGSILPASITQPQTISTDQWSGAAVGPLLLTDEPTYHRFGNIDRNKALDWTYAEESIGELDEDLTFPGLYPSVASVVRNQSSPTGLATVSYTVTFHEPVVGINTTTPFDDFNLTKTSGSLSGYAVTAVAAVSTSIYTVTLGTGTGTGSGTGTLRLDVFRANGIADAKGRGMLADYTTGPEYEIDFSPPALTGFSADRNPVGLGQKAAFSLTFSEDMDESVPPAVTVTTVGNGGIGASAVAQGGNGAWVSPTEYQVRINRAIVPADHGSAQVGISGARDLNGSAMTAAVKPLAIDATIPVVSVDSLATFDVSPALTGTFSDNDTSPTVVISVAGHSYTAAAANGTWSVAAGIIGPLALDTYDVAAVATDAAGNAGSDGTNGELIINNQFLGVNSIQLLDASPVTNGTARFRITFSTDISGIETAGDLTSDFITTVTNGTLDGHAVTGVSAVNGSTYDVAVNSGEGVGSLRLDVLAGGGIHDISHRTLDGDYTAGPVYSVNYTRPILISHRVQPNPAGIDATVNVRLEFSEDMDTTVPPVILLDTLGNGAVPGSALGQGGVGTWVSGTVYEAALDRSLVSGDDGAAQLEISGGRDLAGTLMVPVFESVTVDGQRPTVTVRTRTTADRTPALSGTIADNDTSLSVLVILDGQLITPAMPGNGTWEVGDNVVAELDPGVYDVAVFATDTAGNVGSDPTTGELTIDEVFVGVDSVVRLDASPTAAATVRFLVTYTSDVFGVETGLNLSSNDFAAHVVVGNLSGAAVTAVSAVNASQYIVTVGTGTGDGVLNLWVLSAGGVENSAGDRMQADFTGSAQYAISRTLAPRVISMTIADPPGYMMVFNVQFSEPVTGVETGNTFVSNDFELEQVDGSLNGTEIIGVSTTDLSAYSITVNAGLGEGSFRLHVLSSGGIVDSTGTGMTSDYLAGPVYSVNTRLPAITALAVAPNPAGLQAAPTLTVTFDELMDTTVTPDIEIVVEGGGTIGAGSGAVGAPGQWLNATTYRATVNRVVEVGDDGEAAIAIQGAKDLNGDEMTPDASHSFIIDTAMPIVTVADLETADATPQLTGTLSTVIQDVTVLVSVAGQTQAAVNHGDGTWTLQDNRLAPVSVGEHEVVVHASSAAGNVGMSTGTLKIDDVLLAVDTVMRLDGSPTNAPGVRFFVRFTSRVQGVSTGNVSGSDDFLPETGPGMAGAMVTRIVRAGLNGYVVTVATGTGDGALGLRVTSDGGLLNEHNNPLSGDVVLVPTYDIAHLDFAQQPAPETMVEQGMPVIFEVTPLAGTPPYHYQWQFHPQGRGNGKSLAPVGTDSPELTISAAEWYDSGEYVCVVSDQYESVISAPALLHVDAEVPAAGGAGKLLLAIGLTLAAAVAVRRVRTRAA